MSDLSIVITAYNIPGYIGEAVRSVYREGGDDCEIIIVNDGSTDDTLAVIEGLKQQFGFRVITIENSGPGGARNVGIDAATKPFLMFLDGDDAIYPNGLRHLRAAIDPDVDILFSNRTRFWEATGKSKKYKNFTDCAPTKLAEVPGIRDLMAIHGKVFRRRFLVDSNIRFEEKMFFEDFPFTYQTYALGSVGASISAHTYIYRKRRPSNVGSITQTRLDDRAISDRIKQIGMTLAIADSPGWRSKFGKGGQINLEFGRRLFRHIGKLRHQEDSVIEGIASLITKEAAPYEAQIDRWVTGPKRDVYRAIFKGDVSGIRKGLTALYKEDDIADDADPDAGEPELLQNSGGEKLAP